MRQKIHEIIEPSREDNKLSWLYDIFFITVITISIFPLFFKENIPAFEIIDSVCVVIFIVDYLLHWICADLKFQRRSVLSFIRYPLSPMAIIDLLSILPSISALNQVFKVLRIFRMFRALRVLRVFKFFKYSKNARIIINVFKKQKNALSYVLVLAVAYIIISALIVFNVEPDTFNSYFDAIYWATVSLTTVGYGDIYPITAVGRIVTMISSVFGIAIVALPAGIITAGYMDEMKKISQGDTSNDKNDQ